MKSIFLDDAFLSYYSDDEEQATDLVCGLEILRKSIWFAPNRIRFGDHISIKIERGIDNARHMIALISPGYLKSEWCKMERHTAAFSDPGNLERRLIPVLLQPCPLPSSLQPLLFCDVSKGITPGKLAQIASAI